MGEEEGDPGIDERFAGRDEVGDRFRCFVGDLHGEGGGSRRL